MTATGNPKPGPLPAAALEQVMKAQEVFFNTLNGITETFGKSRELVYQAANFNHQPKVPHAVNGWNTFQAWYAVEGELERPEGWTNAEWEAHVREQYYKHLESKQEEGVETVHEALKEQIDWFENRLKALWQEKKQMGEFDSVLGKIMCPFIQLAEHVYTNYNIHVFGYTIVTNTDLSSRNPSHMWGGSPAFAKAKEDNQVHIRSQLDDLTAMICEVKRVESGIPLIDHRIHDLLSFHPGDKDKRSRSCCLLLSFMHEDTSRIIGKKGGNGSGKGFVAIDSFLRYAATFHMIIYNWPIEVHFPGTHVQLGYRRLTVPQFSALLGSREEFLR
ncbi:hypothetical protein E1B28_010968 [Marasmius oreades]|uniref:Uncharacterized protein n=1 Tax=Marasmius oreades TaxID=181124 RepID=A0A9P7UPQ4_9AGAR|nr:uncharacterized protein E1B28_010968 [Marasmius oreades]KAG7089270.1 hypothetical protein E1B28_010968 [Marasmius oreades]